MSSKAKTVFSARAANVVSFSEHQAPEEADFGAQRMREYGYGVFPMLPQPGLKEWPDGDEFCMVSIAAP